MFEQLHLHEVNLGKKLQSTTGTKKLNKYSKLKKIS